MSPKLSERELSWLQKMDSDLRWFGRRARIRNRWRQLHALGLHGMAKAFDEITAAGEADRLGPLEWLGLLLDREASWRQDKRFAARLRVAKLRQQDSFLPADTTMHHAHANNHRERERKRRAVLERAQEEAELADQEHDVVP